MDLSQGLSWKRSFETGDEYTDSQHLRLFAMANDVLMFIACEEDDLAAESLMLLVGEIEGHLERERDLADSRDKSSLAECLGECTTFSDAVAPLAGAFLSHDEDRRSSALSYIGTCLVSHVTHARMQVAV